MTSQTPSNNWYYARDKKKVGPVTLAQLHRLRAEGVLKSEDMVFQEGTMQWRPLAEVTRAVTGTASSQKLWQLIAGGGIGLVLLGLLAWGLVAILHGPKGNLNSTPLSQVAQRASETDVGNGAQTEDMPNGPKELLRPDRREQTESDRKSEPNSAPPVRQPQDTGSAVETRQSERLPPVVSTKQRPSLVAQVGNHGRVESVAFSPDGKQVLTGGEDGSIRLWDAASGMLIRTFQGDIGGFVAFSPNGKQVLARGDQHLKLWDTASGKEMRVFPVSQAHSFGGAYALSWAFSPDGKQVLTANDEPGGARLWDADSGKEIRAFPQLNGISIAFSPDGKHVLIGSRTGEVRMWDTASGGEILAFRGKGNLLGRGHTRDVMSVAFSPDGKQIISASRDGSARLWDATSGKEIHTFLGKQTKTANKNRTLTAPIDQAAFSPDGKQILTSGADLWDAASGEKILAIEDVYSRSVAFSPDGKYFLTSSFDVARLWDAATGKEVRTFRGHVDPVYSAAFSPDGKHMLAEGAKKAWVWDATRYRPIRGFPLNRSPFLIEQWTFYPTMWSTVFSPDGKQILAGDADTTRLWDVASGNEIRTFQGPSRGGRAPAVSVAFSPDGKQVLAQPVFTQGTDVPVLLWDAATGKEIRTFQARSGADSVGFSPDGKQVYTGGTFWDAASGKEIKRFGTHPNLVAISPNGKQVLTQGEDGTPRLWDAASGKEIQQFGTTRQGLSVSASTMTFSPDGKQILTGRGRVVRLWDVASGKQIHAFEGHTEGIRSVSFSPDGRQVLSGSRDGTARLWDAVSGQQLCSLINFHDGSWAIVAPDNYYMASKGGLEGVAFRVENRAFPFDQFDLKFNRPDKVLERIGRGSPELIAGYRHAYQKRLKRLNFTEEMLSDDFHVPEIALRSAEKLATSNKTLKLKVKANDSTYQLDRLYVDVNGVPVNGRVGINLREHPSKTWEQEIEVELTPGKNRIDVSVLNEKGAESLKETLFIQCDAPARKPNLYVLAVGVSDYQDARFRLTYADKDARDISDFFDSKRDCFGDVKVLRILNRDATREKILQARDFLKDSQVDDQVVLFFAGHGLLDSKLDYYFATADIDFTNPAKRGLPFETIEELLDGIRARKKLVLIDTCHSGEVDKEEIQLVQSEKNPEGEIKTRAFRSGLTRVAPKVGLGNSYQLLQETFADLRRGTGTVVIASAGGAEYAFESRDWKNGVFTYAVLRGLKGEADRNRDGRVQVSELRDYVLDEVRRLTRDQQSPTIRIENLEFDYTVMQFRKIEVKELPANRGRIVETEYGMGKSARTDPKVPTGPGKDHDLFRKGTIWKGTKTQRWTPGPENTVSVVMTVVEREGNTFKARIDIDNGFQIRAVEGTITGEGKISWPAEKNVIEKGAPGMRFQHWGTIKGKHVKLEFSGVNVQRKRTSAIYELELVD